jgi:hypothetical protein
VGDTARDDLDELIESELFQPAALPEKLLTAEILERHGGAVAAVLFYGSCLRRRTSDGVLDFYVLVDDYRAAYPSRLLAWANAALPPNVFYLEVETELGTLRSKYAVISIRDFEAGARGEGLRSGISARFSQPALAVQIRDEAAREAVAAAVAEAVLTTVVQALPLLSASAGSIRFTTEDLWQTVFRETYSAELRPEDPETILNLYRANPERYDRAARAALARLQMGGRLRFEEESGVIEATSAEDSQALARRGWDLRRPLAKLAYVAQLLKTTATFGDWLPYALWKLERHTGTRIVPTERQRRHPLLWGWPLLFRVLWRRDLR